MFVEKYPRSKVKFQMKTYCTHRRRNRNSIDQLLLICNLEFCLAEYKNNMFL